MKNKRILIGAIVSAGIMALAGSAFTMSNTMPPTAVEGFGQQEVTGVTVESVIYNLDSARTNVESVTVTVAHSVELDIFVAFNDEDPIACTDLAPVIDTPEGSSTYTCDLPYVLVDVIEFTVSASGLHEA